MYMQTLENAKFLLQTTTIYFFSVYFTAHTHYYEFIVFYYWFWSIFEPSTLLFIDASHQQINGHKQHS